MFCLKVQTYNVFADLWGPAEGVGSLELELQTVLSWPGGSRNPTKSGPLWEQKVISPAFLIDFIEDIFINCVSSTEGKKVNNLAVIVNVKYVTLMGSTNSRINYI